MNETELRLALTALHPDLGQADNMDMPHFMAVLYTTMNLHSEFDSAVRGRPDIMLALKQWAESMIAAMEAHADGPTHG